MRNALLRSAAAAAMTTALVVAIPAMARQKEQQRVNPNAKAIAEFQEEVGEYVELHKKLAATLPPVPKEATPLQIDQRQRALGALIQKARRDEKQGEIFESDVRPVFRRLLYGLFTGPDGKRIRASINDENPGKIVKLQVNGRYPDTIPISTVPPQILSVLPSLPRELEYRFIGTTLILLDTEAHIIVDFLTGAVPQ